MNTDGTMNGTLVLTSGSLEDRKTIEQLRYELQGLRREMDSAYAKLRDAKDAHRMDIALIGETLISEANDRDWCTEYDEIIDGLNNRLTVELPTREREYDVTVYVRVELKVRAGDEDAARSMAHSMAEDIEGTIDNGSFSDSEGNYPDACVAYIEKNRTDVEPS